MDFLVNHRVGLFLLGSVFFLWVSRKPLMNICSHGFYRFFAFEGILSLVCLNLPFWFYEPFSPIHLLSWLLLGLSVFLVIHGVHFLKVRGGDSRENADRENFEFENTVNLVDTGVYKFIRHPMYTSLLFLAWGAFFKQISFFGCLLALFVTASLVATARIEERENCDYFGAAYSDYMKSSRMFVPGIF